MKSENPKPVVYERRIATQRITGVDERLRVVATIIEAPAYFADSTNSITVSTGSPYRLEYLLALLNSRLTQWRFKLTSTNNNVGTNELDSLPFRQIEFSVLADQKRHNEIVAKVTAMLDSQRHLASARSDKDKSFYENKCQALERQIDRLICELYGVTEGESNSLRQK